MPGIGLGIDLGARSIKVVRIRSTGTRVQVLSAAKIERAIAKEEAPLDPPEGARALLARAGVSGRGVVGASGRDVMLRYVIVPPAPPWRLKKIIDFELRGKAASPEELSTDYRILAVPGGLRKEMVTLAAVGKDGYLSSLFAAVRGLGLKASWACPPSVALFRAFLKSTEYRDNETTFLIDVGHEKLEMVIQRDGQLIFARAAPGGGKRFTQATDGVFRMGLERAEAFKHERARLSAEMPPDSPQQSLVLNSALAEAADQIVGAISGAVRFCSMQARIPKLDYDRLVVSGSGARLKGFREYLLAKVGKPVVFFDPAQAADTSRLRPEETGLFSSPPGEMSIAYGLALCDAEEGLSLSLLPAAEEKKRAFWERDVFGWGAAACALLIAGLLVAGSRIGMGAAQERNAELRELRDRFEIAEKQVGKRLDSIASFAAETRLISKVTSPGNWFLTFFSHQRNVTPEGVSLAKLDFGTSVEGLCQVHVRGVADKAKLENVYDVLDAYMNDLKRCRYVVEADAKTGREGEEMVPFSYTVVLGEKGPEPVEEDEAPPVSKDETVGEEKEKAEE